MLSPTIFPSPNHLYYNTPAGVTGDSNTFVSNYFSLNASEWTVPATSFTIDTKKDFYGMISDFDDFIYSDANEKSTPVFGNYFYLGLNENKVFGP